MDKNIWNEVRIKNIELKNRIVRSATNEHLGTLDGIITDEYINVYEKLAKYDVGLIITSNMAVKKSQRADLTHICINSKENLPKLEQLVKKVHKYESKILCQLSYGGHHAFKVYGKTALTPTKTDNTTEMTKKMINDCINNFVKAIKIAKNVGFDGIQLHLAHGYLLNEFLDPYYNKRVDEYGGSIINRYRIVHNILSNIKDINIDKNFLITVKIDSISKSNSKEFLKEQIEICKLLQKDGVDAIEVSGYDFKNHKERVPYFLENALKVKEKVSLPIILVGGFRKELTMNMALKKGIDLVSMSRPFIRESDFVVKLKNNEESKCINCNQCFQVYKNKYKRCIFDSKISNQLFKNYHKD